MRLTGNTSGEATTQLSNIFAEATRQSAAHSDSQPSAQQRSVPSFLRRYCYSFYVYVSPVSWNENAAPQQLVRERLPNTDSNRHPRSCFHALCLQLGRGGIAIQ